MGFPLGYSDLRFPKLLLNLLLLLSLLRRIVSFAFISLGLDHDPSAPPARRRRLPDPKAVARQIPPAARYEDLGAQPAGCCAVCLHEFARRDEVRRLAACRHVFHRRCLDPWVDLDQWTCPLCRAPIAPPSRPAVAAARHLEPEVWW